MIKKLVSTNLRKFEKNLKTHRHSLIAQINARMLLNLKMINLIQFDHVMVRSENHLKWVFVTLGKCSGRNRSSFLKIVFLHGLHPRNDAYSE